MSYHEFLESKRQLVGQFGFDPVWMPDSAFDFQKAIIEKAVRQGRIGVFADTGLGKTLISLSFAKNVAMKTGGRVLILTPLAVAFQFIDEAERIGVEGVEHTRDGKTSAKITVCNYERLHLLNPCDFEGVILDESAILKNFKGGTKQKIIEFMRKIKYRLLATATPSPNDFIELGNSSEALGYMGYMDMLGTFFRNNQNNHDSRGRNIGDKYYLMPHAEKSFFAWVNQWSIMVKRPSDIGFSDDRYNLPELITNEHIVRNESMWSDGGQSVMFAEVAKTFTEVRHEQKETVQERCEKAVELSAGKTSVYWCNLNDESSLLAELDPEAVEIRGSMTIDRKEDILVSFAKGEIPRIITKAMMTGSGLNWQHCNHTVYFPTWSYEQYYQAIRRFWRFGQTRPVTCDLVISEGQERVMEALHQKMHKAIELYENLVENANASYTQQVRPFDQKVQLPSFL